VVTVTGQLQRQDGQWVRVSTKAARSLDRIAIAPATVEALKAHRQRQAAERKPDWKFWGLVFVKPNGQPYHGAEVLRAFHVACDEAGIPRRRFHDIRHSSATLMRELGVSEETRQARLGHSTTKMSRLYGKASIDQDRRAAELLGEALR
jgi:integrase